jgi:hypothetical protein
MNFKKILTISIILIALAVSIGVVCAESNGINMGKITSSNVNINNVEPIASPTNTPISGPGLSSSSSSSGEYNVDFSADAQVNISKMSEKDKKILTEAVNNGSGIIVLDITDGHSMTIELHQGGTMSIDGDTLSIQGTSSYTVPSSTGEIKLNSVGVKTSDNHLFTAKA